MRIFLLVVWLLIPVVAVAYHLGPGQEQQTLDEAAKLIAQVERYVANEQWIEAVAAAEAAIETLPKDRVDVHRRLRLERAKAQMQSGKLPEAHDDLTSLVADLQADKAADPKLLEESQAALANSQYYLTWLMRLEGRSRDDWEPQIESSRQLWRMLAEQATAAGQEKAATQYREDLESSIRLARMDLAELQGLPLPSQ